MRYQTVTDANLSKESVYEITKQTRQSFGYEPGDDLKDLMKRIGGKVKVDYNSYASDASGIDIHGNNSFTIFIDADTGRTRDRFTIAHNFGHYILHYLWKRGEALRIGATSIIEKVSAPKFDTSRAEWEANWFAAEFLVPAEETTLAIKRRGASIYTIADKYGVSARMTHLRCQALGLI